MPERSERKRKFGEFVAGLSGLLDLDHPHPGDVDTIKGRVREELRWAHRQKRVKYAMRLAVLDEFLRTREFPKSGAFGRKNIKAVALRLVAAGLFGPRCMSRKAPQAKGGPHGS